MHVYLYWTRAIQIPYVLLFCLHLVLISLFFSLSGVLFCSLYICSVLIVPSLFPCSPMHINNSLLSFTSQHILSAFSISLFLYGGIGLRSVLEYYIYGWVGAFYSVLTGGWVVMLFFSATLFHLMNLDSGSGVCF